MITLNYISQKGAVKKVLHIVDLRLYIIKEQAIADRDFLEKQKAWLALYQEQLQKSKRFVPVYKIVNNTPEGHTSVLMQYMERGSLSDVLDNVNSLNEKSVKQLAVELLKSLKKVHKKTQKPYNALSLNQVLFDLQGRMKLSLGISNKLGLYDDFKQLTSKLKQIFSQKQRIKSPQVARTTFSLETNCAQSAQTDFTHIDDIFDFGVLLLLCAVGKDIPILNKEFEQEEVLRGNRLAQQKSPKVNEPRCCLLHMILDNHHSQPNIYLNELSCDYVQAILLRGQQFSAKFISFLCRCLKLREKDRSSPLELLQSDYLKSADEFSGPNIALVELLNICNNQLSLSQAQEQLDRMCSKLGIVVPECSALFTTPQGRASLHKLQNLSEADTCILSLAKHFGLPRHTILSKIRAAIKDASQLKPPQQQQQQTATQPPTNLISVRQILQIEPNSFKVIKQ